MNPAQEKLNAALRQFSGTEMYYPHFTGTTYTDGVRYLAREAKAYWLIDLAMSYAVTMCRKVPSIVIELKVNDDRTAVATISNGSGNTLHTQKIEYTDFPLPEIKLYFKDGVLFLPSED